jgi:hypothetical protein
MKLENVSTTKIILVIGGAVFVGYLLWWAFRGSFPLISGYRYFTEDPRSKEYLTKVAAEINRSVPVMIDKETELLPAEGADGMLIYNYRLVGHSVAQLDANRFAAGAKERISQSACSRPETRDDFLKRGVTLRYSYFDKDKRHIASVDVAPSDCGFFTEK